MADSDAGARRGILMVVSSPSGAGKTTLAHLLAQNERLEFSVSYTTRPQRPGEVDGRDCHFVTPEVFERMVERGELAEHAWVFGNHYGDEGSVGHADTTVVDEDSSAISVSIAAVIARAAM